MAIRDFVESVRGEYLRYKALGEGAIRQVDDADLSRVVSEGSNSIATICWHLSGNLRSRFTDFLLSDGEKPWRHRDEEFEGRTVTRAELMAKWDVGWVAVLDAIDSLNDDQLGETVTIRSQPLRVHEALHRSLAHTAYHVGQIVYVGKLLRGPKWSYLSIPPGGSASYNQAPRSERPAAHAEAVRNATGPKA